MLTRGGRPRAAGIAAVLVTTAVVGGSGCGLQTKAGINDRIVRSFSLAEAHGGAVGQLRLRVQVVKISIGGGGGTGGRAIAAGGLSTPKKFPPRTSPPLGLQLDIAHERAEILGIGRSAIPQVVDPTLAAAAGGLGAVPTGRPPTQPPPATAETAPGGAPPPVALFDRYAVYVYSPPKVAPAGTPGSAAPAANPAAAPAGSDAGDETEDIPRVWTKLDFASLKSTDRGRLLVLNPFPVVSPIVALRLVKGSLTGSVKTLGTEQIDGVATTHYQFNLDRGKATRGMTDKRRELIEHIFRADNLKGNVLKHAEVWLDDSGLARRVLIPFHQELDKEDVMNIGYILDLRYDSSPRVDVPVIDSVSEVGDIARLVSSGRS